MVAHEIGHTQQKIEERDNENKSNVLANTLAEGMCDFLAELVYKPISQPYTIYGNKNEYEYKSHVNNSIDFICCQA